MAIESSYELELDNIVRIINKEKARSVCLQFPDGLKQKATEAAEFIEKNTNAKCTIWLESCFGACDLPIQVEKLGIDLLIQFGHSRWHYRNIKTIIDR